MTPQVLVDVLLESLPGGDWALVDEIMGIIDQVSKRCMHAKENNQPGHYVLLQQRFEQEVNTALAPYHIRLGLRGETHGTQGITTSDGNIIIEAPPYCVTDMRHTRSVIAHELVHQSQNASVVSTGQMHDRNKSERHRKERYPGNPAQKYLSNPAETTAWARDFVDRQRFRKTTKDIKQQLRYGANPERLSFEEVNPYAAFKDTDPKTYRRFLKHTAGYANQLPENMNAQHLVSTLLEGASGASPETLDAIMDIIDTSARNLAVMRPANFASRFEQEVNPHLAAYHVRFDSNDPMLRKYGAPAMCGLDGVVIRTPSVPDAFHRMRTVISHELVHYDQIMSAVNKGGVSKMITGSQKRVLRGGRINRDAYRRDKHELDAYARTAVDDTGATSQDQALRRLRQRGLSGFRSDDPAHKRFMKKAYGHAQQLPEK